MAVAWAEEGEGAAEEVAEAEGVSGEGAEVRGHFYFENCGANFYIY